LQFSELALSVDFRPPVLIYLLLQGEHPGADDCFALLLFLSEFVLYFHQSLLVVFLSLVLLSEKVTRLFLQQLEVVVADLPYQTVSVPQIRFQSNNLRVLLLPGLVELSDELLVRCRNVFEVLETQDAVFALLLLENSL
jgi:hypothetical protein